MLNDVADGLARVDDQGERVRLAFTLFDTEGVRFVNALQLGAAGFNEIAEAQRRFGVVSNEQARTLDNLNREYLRLARVFRTGLAQGVAESADEFTRLNELFLDRLPVLVPQVIRFSVALIEGLGFLVDHSRTIIAVVAAIAGLRGGAALGRIFGPTGAIVGGLLGSLGAVAGALELFDRLRERVENVGDSADASRARLTRLGNELDLVIVSDLNAVRAQPVNVELFDNTALLRTADILNEITDTGQAQLQQISLRTQALGLEEGAQRQLEFRSEARNRFAAEGVRLQRELQAATIAQLDAARAVQIAEEQGALTAIRVGRQAGDAARQQITGIEEAIIAWRSQREEVEQLIQVIDRDLGAAYETLAASSAIDSQRDAFRGFLNEVLAGTASMEDAARRFGQTILQEVINRLISQPITDFLFGILSGGLGGGGGGIGQLFGGFFQRGGIAHGLSIVGENGPELVNFREPARVFPNEALSGLGGVSLFQEFNIQSTDGPGVRRALAEATPAIVDASVGAVRQEPRQAVWAQIGGAVLMTNPFPSTALDWAALRPVSGP